MPSTIEWTDETWNPVVGCDLVSPGCTNCYAMKMAGRLEAMADANMAKTGAAGPMARYQGTTRKTKVGPVWTGLINAAPDDVIAAPLRWKRPRKVFVNSMSDLFAPGVPRDLVDRVWAVMAASPQHTYQILTKRPEAMRAYVKDILAEGMIRLLHTWVDHPTGHRPLIDLVDVDHVAKPLPNVWLGVSTEDQPRADERVPIILDTPAAIRWVSAEPLLGRIDFTRIQAPRYCPEDHETDWRFDALNTGDYYEFEDSLGVWEGGDGPDRSTKLDLIVVGGESGAKARPVHPDWVREIRDDCANSGVDFFFKQWGEWAPGENAGGKPMSRSERVADWYDDRWTYSMVTPRQSDDMHVDDEPVAWRFGKKIAGRLLDGVEHNAMPAVSHA